IGEQSGAPVQISHCKASGSTNWGKGTALVRTIHAARERGLDVTGDQYPYLAGSTMLSTLLPPWAHEGGVPDLMRRLRSEEMRARMTHDIEHGVGDWWNPAKNTTWEQILIASAASTPEIEGNSLAALASAAANTPLETLYDTLLENHCAVLMIIF